MIWIVIVLGIVLWLVLSIKIVGPAEMAVLVLFGKPVKFCDSGFQFVPFLPGLQVYLARYPKKMYNLNYPAREVITKAGEYPPRSGVFYGAQVIKVDSTAYLNFPREQGSEKTHPLIKILRAQVPTDDKELLNWTEEAVVGAIRVAFGQMTWREAVENIKKVNAIAEEVFKRKDGALIKAGFRDPGIRLVVSEIKLPEKLEAALPKPDQARLEEDAARHVAKRQAIEWVRVILEAMAISRGKKTEDIEREIDASEDLQREFLDYAKDLNIRLEEAERGAFLDIRTQNPLQDLIALWRRMPMGRPPEAAEAKEPIKEPEKEPPVQKEESEEEKFDRLFFKKDLTEEELKWIRAVMAKLPKEARMKKLTALAEKRFGEARFGEAKEKNDQEGNG